MKGRDYRVWMLKRRMMCKNQVGFGGIGTLMKRRMQKKKSTGLCKAAKSCQAFIFNRRNYCKSQLPSRLMFFDRGSWKDFPASVREALIGGFSTGRPTIEVKIDGSHYLVDFLRMLQIDLGSGCERSIAWIDVEGKCFFPKVFICVSEDVTEPFELEIEIKIDPSACSEVGNNGGMKPGAGKRVVSREIDLHDAVMGDENTRKDGNGLLGSCARDGEEKDKDNAGFVANGNGNNAEVPLELPIVNKGEFSSLAGQSSKETGGKEGKDTNCKESDRLSIMENGFGEDGDVRINATSAENGLLTESNSDAFKAAPVVVEKFVHVSSFPDVVKNSLILNGEESEKWFQIQIGVEHPRMEIDINKHPSDFEDTRGHPGDDKQVDVLSQDRIQNHSFQTNVLRNNSGLTELDEIKDFNTGKEQPFNVHDPPPVEHSVFASLGDRVVKMEVANKEYAAVSALFLKGLGGVGPLVSISSIHKCPPNSAARIARLQAFQSHIEMTRLYRGNANVRYAWHGIPSHALEGVVLHGFGHSKADCGPETYGVGVYLSPDNLSCVSVSCAEPDAHGEQHVILCRVIMGNIEQVQAGSSQYHPSAESFDTGVDDLSSPRHYIVWSTHMNSHILPEYVVSFRIPDDLKGKFKGEILTREFCDALHAMPPSGVRDSTATHFVPRATTQGPVPAVNLRGCTNTLSPQSGLQRISYQRLFSLIRPQLPESKVQGLDSLFRDFQAGRVAKNYLVTEIRSIVGDPLLRHALSHLGVQGSQ